VEGPSGFEDKEGEGKRVFSLYIAAIGAFSVRAIKMRQNCVHVN
jgi:hypothetical protein